MEEAVTDQIVKMTKIQIDQTAMVGGYDLDGRVAPGMHELQPNTDSQRQIGIDGDIVDIQTNQM